MARYVAFLVLLFCGVTQANCLYRVTISDSGALSVKACFSGSLPTKLYRGSARQREVFSGSSAQFRLAGNWMYIRSLDNNNCLSYSVDLTQLDDRKAYRFNQGWLVNTHSWLYAPDSNFEVAFDLPASQQVSAPWKQLSANRFLLGLTPLDWTSRIAVGDFVIRTITQQDTRIEIALTNVPKTQHDKVERWIQQASDALTTAYGHYPTPFTQVLVVDIGRQREPVPWAEVQRGGSTAVHFFIDSSRPFSEFSNDWTAVHEFSHLLIPHIDLSEKWISEGIATYYQTVLRARQGMISEREGWQKLRDGFNKGQRFSDNQSIHTSRSFKHMYWGGAALFFKADTELRLSSNGARSLDTVLAQLATCCLASGKEWNNDDFIAKLNALGQTDVFSRLRDHDAKRRTFPDVSLLEQIESKLPENDKRAQENALLKQIMRLAQ